MEDIPLPVKWSPFCPSDQSVPWPDEMSMDAVSYLEKYCRWTPHVSTSESFGSSGSVGRNKYFFMHTLNDEIFDDIVSMLDDLYTFIERTYDIRENSPLETRLRPPKTLKRSLSDLAKRVGLLNS